MKRNACQPWRLKIEGSRRPRGLPTGPGTAVLLNSTLYLAEKALSASVW